MAGIFARVLKCSRREYSSPERLTTVPPVPRYSPMIWREGL